MVLLAKVFMLLLVLCTLVVHRINERMDKGEHSSVILFVSETYLKVQCVKVEVASSGEVADCN